MDENRFATVTRFLTSMPSRRHLLRGLAGAGLGLGAARLPATAAVKKQRKPKKPKPNAFGCLDVGDPCKRAGQCCSGICEGKKGRRRCKAHDTGNCPVGKHSNECGGTNVACTTSLGKQGNCATTTGNAAYCAFFDECFACKTDADCQTVDGGALGSRAACIRCADCGAIDGTACAAPDVPQTM